MTTDVVAQYPIATVAQHPGLVRWVPSQPIAASTASLFLTPAAAAKLVSVYDVREPLRESSRRAFDQFVEIGVRAHF